MAWYPNVVRSPIAGLSGGTYRGGPPKSVAHKTQGNSYSGAAATYLKNGCPPHFTIDLNGIRHQHLDTNRSSYALRNAAGGVETNRDGAIQVEICGYSGQTMPPAQLRSYIELLRDMERIDGVAPVWPAGRPPKDSNSGYGLNNGHRNARLWDTTSGHYGHSQVPENTHWDPAFTDVEWAAITTRATGTATPAPAEPAPKPGPVLTGLHAIRAAIDAAKKKVLRKGSRGDAVVWAQLLLNKHLDGPDLNPDGDFGKDTDAAVRRLQTNLRNYLKLSKKDMPTDGIIGPSTWFWLDR